MEILFTSRYNNTSRFYKNVRGKHMDKKITWLHLSDLHFRVAEDNFESRLIYDKLLEDLKHIEKDIDLVFVTGDIAFSGRTEEYALASEFFNGVLEILNIKGAQTPHRR